MKLRRALQLTVASLLSISLAETYAGKPSSVSDAGPAQLVNYNREFQARAGNAQESSISLLNGARFALGNNSARSNKRLSPRRVQGSEVPGGSAASTKQVGGGGTGKARPLKNLLADSGGADPGDGRPLAKLSASNRDAAPFSVVMDAGTVRVLRGGFQPRPSAQLKGEGQNFEHQVRSFVVDHHDLFGINAEDTDLRVQRAWVGERGRQHLVLQRQMDRVPVIGEELSFHGGQQKIYYVNARYKNLAVDPASSVSLSSQQAVDIVLAQLARPMHGQGRETSSELSLLEQDNSYRYVYQIELLTSDMVRWLYLVDASDGTILKGRKNIHTQLVTASGVDSNGSTRSFTAWQEDGNYYLADPSTPRADSFYDPLNVTNDIGDQFTVDAQNFDSLDQLNYSDSFAQNSGWDPAAVSAHANSRMTYDYYLDTHGRDGMDGHGMNIISIVHFGQQMNNAFWNGYYLVYGDGDNQVFSNLAGCLDVVAHEMTHGVIDNSAGLIYENQSGALNESFADIMAAMVDTSNWLLGEDCTLASPGYLRSMSSPNDGLDFQPASMSEFRHLPNTEGGDWGGVHVNSGIPNRAAYLVAEGLGSDSIGRSKTGKIFYRALTTYLNASSEFVDARFATLQAAADLYGANSTEVAALNSAWDAVGVGVDVESSTPPDTPPIEAGNGEDWIAYLYPVDGTYDRSEPEDFDLYLQAIDIPFTAYDPDLDIGPLNLAQYVAPTRPATVSYEGSFFSFYVGLDSNIYIISPDGSEELLLEGNDNNSFAVSPDLRYIAVTPVDLYDNRIYVYDFDIEQWLSFELESPNTNDGAEELTTALFADSIAFDYTGRRIIYDYFSCAPIPGEPCDAAESAGTWSIGELDVAQNRFYFPFPAQPSSIDVGYPSYARNSDQHFVFDLNDWSDWEQSGVFTSTLIFDKETQEFQVVGIPGLDGADEAAWGVPSFTGDDSAVVFQANVEGQAGKTGLMTPLLNYQYADGEIRYWNDFDIAFPQAHRDVTRQIEAQLQPSTTQLNFGDVNAGGAASLELTLSNQGNRAIDIVDVSVTGDYFLHDLTNTRISPDEKISVDVDFYPGLVGGAVGEVLAISHTGDNARLIVNLRGNIVGSDITIEPIDTNANGRVDWDEGIQIGDEISVSASDMQLLRLYSGALGRIPDLGGFDYWKNRVATGTQFSQMGDEFFWSNEMQVQMDSDGDGLVTNEELVDHLYVNVLQRVPDDGGFNFWLGKLEGGEAKGFIIASFLNGQEYIDNTTGLLADFALENSDIWILAGLTASLSVSERRD